MPAIRIMAEHIRGADLKGGRLLDYLGLQASCPSGTRPQQSARIASLRLCTCYCCSLAWFAQRSAALLPS